MLPGNYSLGSSLVSGGTAAATGAVAAGQGFMDPVADYAAVNSAVSFVSSMFGGGVTDTDRARLARAKSYVAGAVAGSVKSAQLALGAKQTNTAKEEQQLYAAILQQIQRSAPAVYQQATSLGALHDAADGRQGLAELLRLKIRFTEPGAGHPTGYKQYNNTDPSTMAIVAQLAQLSTTPTGNPDVAVPLAPITGNVAPGAAPGATMAPAAGGMPGGSMLPWILLAAFGVALLWIARK